MPDTDDLLDVDSRLAHRAERVAEMRVVLADVVRELHEVHLELLDDDFEVVLSATYRVSDVEDRLRAARLNLEMAL